MAVFHIDDNSDDDIENKEKLLMFNTTSSFITNWLCDHRPVI